MTTLPDRINASICHHFDFVNFQNYPTYLNFQFGWKTLNDWVTPNDSKTPIG